MIFKETGLPGAYVIEPERLSDARGFFARIWCEQEIADFHLNKHWVQSSISFNKQRGTLRGMHFQIAPHEEIKLVRCTMGAIFDVIIDLRPTSKTRLQCYAIELSAANRRTLYIPGGFAHGFQTVQDNSEVHYQMSAFYAPACARGVRWNDPAFQIEWPQDQPVINERDNSYPDYNPQQSPFSTR